MRFLFIFFFTTFFSLSISGKESVKEKESGKTRVKDNTTKEKERLKSDSQVEVQQSSEFKILSTRSWSEALERADDELDVEEEVLMRKCRALGLDWDGECKQILNLVQSDTSITQEDRLSSSKIQ